MSDTNCDLVNHNPLTPTQKKVEQREKVRIFVLIRARLCWLC